MTESRSGDLSGKVVLVTGGVRGTGRAISRAFAAHGAHVIANYFHGHDEAPGFLEDIEAAGGSAEVVRASVAKADHVARMFHTVAERHGGLDILVHNAGAGRLGPVDELTDADWQRSWDTDLHGARWCAQHAAPLMERRGSGAIVNVSSIGANLVLHQYSACAGAKAAVEALTRYLAVEYAPRNIRVNAATPGVLDSTVVRRFPNARILMDRVREATPLGHRLGRQDEFAELVVFLASPYASWITGQNVVADGGMSLCASLLSAAPPERSGTVERSKPSGAAATGGAARTSRSSSVAARPRPPVPADPGALIAVVGMGVVTPGANTPEELWHTLEGEQNTFGQPNRYDATSFYSADPDVEDRSYTRESGFITDFRPHRRLRAELDAGRVGSCESTTLWLRHSLYSALEKVRQLPEDRWLAAFGYTADGSQDLEEHLVLAGYGERLSRKVDDALAPKVLEWLAHRYDRGDAPPHECLPHRVGRNAIAGILPEATELVMVDTACSSSLYSLDLGVKALREGTCDIAACGGAFAYSARNLVLFSKLQGLSRTGEVRSFDQGASGVLFSDGAGVLVLKRLERARTDGDEVFGVVTAVGLSCDGSGKAIYAPNEEGQEFALRRAYGQGGVDPAEVDWVIAHSTGTPAGDKAELTSLHQVAGAGPPALLSSNKAIIGHTGWAAGTVSVVEALLGLRQGAVPPQRYLSDPIPALKDSRFVPPPERIKLPDRSPRTVAVSAFGFGGTNAHLLLREETEDCPDRLDGPRIHDDGIVIVAGAAHVPGAQDRERLSAWLRGQAPAPDPGFGDDYPLPGFQEVPLPPATLRNMDRAQIMTLRAFAGLDERVRDACRRLHDTTGVIAGHMGPTRRAVHYALRCYLGDLERALPAGAKRDPQVKEALATVGEEVRGLVPASTEDSFPGIMPNVIPARLASRTDMHGLNVTVDTGPDAGLAALRAAEGYLRHGDLDLAVVAGVHGNSTQELRAVLDGDGEVISEGAFLLVLARESTARAERLPVLARVRTRMAAGDPDTCARRMPPLSGAGRTYLGADPVLAVLACLEGGSGTRTISSCADWGPQLHLDVADAPPEDPATREDHAAPEREAVPKDEAAPTVDPPAAANGQRSCERVEVRLTPTPPRDVRPGLPAFPPRTLVAVADPALLNGYRVPEGVTVVSPPPPDGGADRQLPDPDQLARLLPDLDVPIEHLRVIADVEANTVDPHDLSAVDRLRALHDLAFLAAQRWSEHSPASCAVLLLDAVRDGVPHPATGVFTGLVKALAREEPDALSIAVLTEDSGLDPGLELLAAETAREQRLAVSVHDSRGRFAPELVDAPVPERPPAWLPIGRDSVVVAAGGSRGLTARVLEAIAAQAAPAIWVLGRQRPAVRPGIGSRAAFLTEERRRHPDWSVARLCAEYDRRSAAAQTRDTLDRLARHCGPERVHHIVCDLTDPAAVRAAVDQVHAAHPRVDLLLNAAGLHNGGTVGRLTLDRVRRVRDTKLLGLLNLRGAFAGRAPRRWFDFGSLLAVLGWPGEADYCSGNDLLAAAARWEHRFGEGVQTTLGWSLWDESGFAAEPVTRELLRRQDLLTGISDEEGTRTFLAELTAPRIHPEITYLGPAERALLDGRPRPGARPGPSAQRVGTFFRSEEPGARSSDPAKRSTGGQPGLTWRPCTGRDGYLRHHTLRGLPTLPGSLIAELAAEHVTREQPAAVVTALHQLVFQRPVTTREEAPNSVYRTRSLRADRTGLETVRVLGDITAPDGRVLRADVVHAELGVEYGPRTPPTVDAPAVPGREAARPGTPVFYRPRSPIRLSGPFASLTDLWVGAGSATARFAPEVGEWGERFAACRLPVLLIDALTQIALLIDGRSAEPDADPGIARVPTAIGRVELFTTDNDTGLLRLHGPGRITLSAVDDRGAAWAAAPDGTLLARLIGVRAAPAVGAAPRSAQGAAVP
ncbi:SDR family oxidoreductase [Streptomyces sp. NPDC002838]|uniref:SDR family oxidoreductase n=1 Tax=Streptomyces sp. NPDC002838 TaxID=3154436 RepID=UPI003329C2A3